MQRIGVFVCWCGSNIAATVDVQKVAEQLGKEPGVVHSANYQYMCSQAGQELIKDAIKQHRLTGIVVCSCSPRMHEATFRKTAAAAGLNPYMVEIANIREQCSWIHKDIEEATEKAIILGRTAIAKLKLNAEVTIIEKVNTVWTKVEIDGETGYVCVTGLHNTAMPMLRYRLNDLASIHSNQICSCGNPNPTINIKAGRMTEFIILDNLSVYSEAALYCPINSGLSISVPSQNDILFNIKLNALDDYEIQVYQQPSKDINIQNLLGELFRAYSLPNVRFTVTYSASVDHSKPSGLLRMRGAT